MISSTALCPTMIPRPWRSSAPTLIAPYVPPDALWTSVISPASRIRRNARGETGRSFDA
jgi:hypothetical protein